jgi:SAM-dependent methyltransferase
MQMLLGYRRSQALYVAAKLSIADVLLDVAKDSDELAAATNTHAPTLRRLLRMLAACGVLEEDDRGRFRLTQVGALLRRDVPGSMRAFVLFMTGEECWRAWGALLHSVQTGESAFEHLFGMNAFDYYARFPERERSQVHEEAMAVLTSQSDAALVSTYDFSQFGTLVDVGGGNGALLAALLGANPRLRGILFDLPNVVTRAPELLEKAGVVDRCRIVAGSFFESVPEGGDAYVMKRIIHDWDDNRAGAILRACCRAMNGKGRLLILDEVLPERAEPSDAASFMFDMEMLLVAPGGRERTEEEFRQLLAGAGFKLNRVFPTGFMRLGVVEGLPAHGTLAAERSLRRRARPARLERRSLPRTMMK